MEHSYKYIGLFMAMALVLGAGCWRKREEFYYKIPASAYGYMPYDDNASFSMRHSAGSMVHFSLVDHRHESFPIEGCAECRTREYGEVDSYEFLGDNPALKLQVALSVDGYEGSTNEPAIGFIASSNASYGLSLATDPCPPTVSAYRCLDSIVLQGRTYYHVYQMPLVSNYSSGAFPDSLWYNAQRGFLKISMFNGEYWELLP